GGDPLGFHESGDPVGPVGGDLGAGGRGEQADHDVDHQGGGQAVVDRLVGVDAAELLGGLDLEDDHGGQGDDGPCRHGQRGADAVAALPDEPAEDGDQQPADEDVVGDGQGGDDVVDDDGQDDGDHAEAEHPVAVGGDVVFRV